MKMLGSLIPRAFSNFKRFSTKALNMDSYIWIDLELTGLDIHRDTIMEVACIVTTPDLEVKGEPLNLIIHQPDEVLDKMSSWCKAQHEKTGLTEACRKSAISLKNADVQVSDFINLHTRSKGLKYLAGNSVYMDKIFLDKDMPKVSNLIHYRLIDVSTIKILASHWYPESFASLCKKKLNHRALDDIHESIEELKAYRANLFK